MDGDEALVGGELVHNRRAAARPILGEARHLLHLENSLRPRCHPSELVAPSHLHFPPQFLLNYTYILTSKLTFTLSLA